MTEATTRRYATRDLIRAADDLKCETVEVPEWGGMVVTIRSMTGAERDRWEARLVESRDAGAPLANIRARLMVLTAVDEAGARLFTDDAADWLGGKSAAALGRLFTAASRLNRLGRVEAGPTA